MPTVVFAPALQRHVASPPQQVQANTVRAALDATFAVIPKLRDYVLEDQGQLRKHVLIFIDGKQLRDRELLADVVAENSEIYVVQALSGG
ncbi:MAG: MoaD/ThiS family protein [Spongiibacteraceae bacterium]